MKRNKETTSTQETRQQVALPSDTITDQSNQNIPDIMIEEKSHTPDIQTQDIISINMRKKHGNKALDIKTEALFFKKQNTQIKVDSQKDT